LFALAMTMPSAAGAQLPAPPAARLVAPAPRSALGPAGAVSPPRDLSDLQGWLDYKARIHAAALPLEARIFHQRGLLARASGMTDEGMRWARASAELDPSYVAPHLALASWTLLHDPSQALLQSAIVIELARRNFLFQLAAAGNTLYRLLQAIYLALLAAGFMVVILHLPELRHPWQEWLARKLSPTTARGWSWALVVLPYFAGLGLALPTVVLLGILWPALRARERLLFVGLTAALVSVPWASLVLDRVATPLDETRAPLYGVPLLEGEPYSRARQDRLAGLAAQHPGNPYLQFALAWTARRGGDLATAEAAYRRALASWPRDDRVLNDLGNVLAMQGRQDEALDLYQRAIRADGANAAAYFNASQIYTQRFEYRPATEALSRASALDFDLVRTYQSQATEDGLLPLVDQWIAPRGFWIALASTPGGRTASVPPPPAWRGHIEASGWRFSLFALLLAVSGLVLGLLGHRSMPLRTCSNCERVVCRRCAQRRREVALCPRCAVIEGRAESREFARVLLAQHRRQFRRRHDLIRTAFAALLPGFGLLAFRRVFTPVLLLAIAASLADRWIGGSPPFAVEPRLAVTGTDLPLPVAIGLCALVYAWSLLGYGRCVARARAQAASLAAPVRSRSLQATRHEPAVAA
jgi:tetratricopeptide (TPR) repeat protein